MREEEVQSNADARVNRTIREADERIARLKAEAQNQIGSLQNELAQATRGIDQVKAEANKRIERVKMEADARVAGVETETKKRIDLIRCENEDKVVRVEADLTEAKDRADRAEQWLMLIRRVIEDHLNALSHSHARRAKVNQSGGTLTAIASTHAIAVFGDYMVSTFVASTQRHDDTRLSRRRRH